MRQILLSIAALLISIAILILANGLQGTLIGVRARMEGFSTGVTGLVIAAYSVGHILGALYTPSIVTRVGHIRVFAALASLASASAILFIIVISPWAWVGLRVMSGACLAGLFLVVESWLNGRATNNNRGTILSIYMVINFGAVALSQQLMNVADPAGIGLFVLSSVLFSVALVPVTMTRFEAPHTQKTPRMQVRRLFSISPMGVAGAFVGGFAGSAFTGMGPVYALETGLDTSQIAMFMSMIFLGGMAFQPPVGWISDRMDRRNVLVMICLGTAAASMLMHQFGAQNVMALYTMAFVMGGFVLAINSISIAHTNDMIDQVDLVSAGSTLLILSGLGAALGPVAVSAAMDISGPHQLFIVVSVICLMLVVFGLYRMTQREAMQAEDLTPYVPVPYTTQRVSRLDPRVRWRLRTRQASKKLRKGLKSLKPTRLTKNRGNM